MPTTRPASADTRLESDPAALRHFRRGGLNSSRVHLEAFVRRAATSVPAGSLMLDAGAGDGLYAPFFTHLRYESADFGKLDKPYAALTYECDLSTIPVEDARYDLVVLTQVLEHLPEPAVVLRELNRTMKPGARLWLSQPFYFEEHEQPYDFYRYTQFGLTHLLTTTGYAVEEVSWLEGYAGTLSYQLGLASRSLPRRPAAFGGGIVGVVTALASAAARPTFRALSKLYARADVAHKITTSGHCKNYSVVARKLPLR
jgi:SAM-dependent methyltransferase